MEEPSITSTESFRFRAQKREQARVALMGLVFAVVLVTTILRRLADGVVMTNNTVFGLTVGVLASAIGFEAFMLVHTRRLTRASRLVPLWTWKASAAIELAVPIALLSILVADSPRGAYAALSAPALLLAPLVVMLSVLRLRSNFTLWTGIGAAVAHWTLAAIVIASIDAPWNQVPVLLTYGVLLALTGVAGALVARAARRYVAEAVDEATAREAASRQLANIQRDLAVARDIQAGLLPSAPPRLAGFDIAGMNRPADETGGD